jgi:hypothetical protein
MADTEVTHNEAISTAYRRAVRIIVLKAGRADRSWDQLSACEDLSLEP